MPVWHRCFFKRLPSASHEIELIFSTFCPSSVRACCLQNLPASHAHRDHNSARDRRALDGAPALARSSCKARAGGTCAYMRVKLTIGSTEKGGYECMLRSDSSPSQNRKSRQLKCELKAQKVWCAAVYLRARKHGQGKCRCAFGWRVCASSCRRDVRCE